MKTIQNIIDSIFTSKKAIDPKKLEAENIPADTSKKIAYLQQMLVEHSIGQTKQAKLQTESGADTFQVIKDLKESLTYTLVVSKSVQGIIKWMFSLTFILGFILIGFAIYFGLQGNEFLATAFGGFGMISIVTLLVKDPPLKMQDSRSNYAQLTIGMLAWLNDLVDKAAMARQNQIINEKVQNSELESLENKKSMHNECIQHYLSLSNTQIGNTVKLLNLIEEVAEPGSKGGFSLEEIMKAEKNLSKKE